MILHQDRIIKLDYNPATDILQVVYPDLESHLLPEIKESLKLMVSTIRNYDVKKLLIDSSNTAINADEEEIKELSMHLASDLANTRLVKVARIQPVDPIREKMAQENISRINHANLLPYEVQTFSNRPEALNWLT